MKQFTGLLFLASTSVIAIGCASDSQVLTVRNPFKSDNDPFQTEGDPFQAAAKLQNGAQSQPQPAAHTSAPGYAAINGASSTAVPGGSMPGWSSTRHAPPAGAGAARPQQPWQTAAVPQQNVQLTFRAASSLPESQTEVVNAAATPEAAAGIPAIGNSLSRAADAGDPFQQGNVTTADFIETEESPITQLGAEQPSHASPATLEMPVFAKEDAGGDPFNETPSQPAASPEWWDQQSGN